MDDRENQTQAEALAPAAESQPQSQGEEDGEEQARNEDDKLIANAQKLMEKITSSPENPSPFVLHALASILETQESRYGPTHFFFFSQFYLPVLCYQRFWIKFRGVKR